MRDDLREGSEPERGPATGMGRPAKIVLGILLGAIVVYVLFTQVFPRIERYMDDPSLGAIEVVVTSQR